MIIRDERKNKQSKFEDINRGQAFLIGELLYSKIGDNRAISLQTLEAGFIEPSILITPVNIEIIIKD